MAVFKVEYTYKPGLGVLCNPLPVFLRHLWGFTETPKNHMMQKRLDWFGGLFPLRRPGFVRPNRIKLPLRPAPTGLVDLAALAARSTRKHRILMSKRRLQGNLSPGPYAACGRKS